MANYTPEQIESRRRSVAKYATTVDRINCQFPKGTKDRIKTLTGDSCNNFIKNCVLTELDRLERLNELHK